MVAYGGDEQHGGLVTRAGLDDLTENRHQDFAGDSEDWCVLDVSKSESGDLRCRPRSDFTVRDERLKYDVRIAGLSTGALATGLPGTYGGMQLWWWWWRRREDVVAVSVVRPSFGRG